MGVWGLLSFCQMANPPIGQQISLSDMARKGATPKQQPPGSTVSKAPVLILDGYALAHHLFFRAEQCCWWDGGEMRDYAQCVRNWVREVQACGLQLCCILDGMLEQRKEATAVQRVSVPPTRTYFLRGWTSQVRFLSFFMCRVCARDIHVTCKSVYVCVCMYVYTHTPCMRTCICILTSIDMKGSTQLCTVRFSWFTQTWIHTLIHRYIHTHIHI